MAAESPLLTYKDWFAMGYANGRADATTGKPYDDRLPSEKVSEERRREMIAEFQREIDEREAIDNGGK